MRRGIITIVVALAMVVVGLGIALPVEAAETHHSQGEAVTWIKARADESWWENVDGVNGCQCVDLIQKYYQWFGYGRLSGNACDYKSGRLPAGSGWYYSNTPIPGAVFVKDADSTWTTGHVGLVYAVDGSKIYTVETNIGSPYDGGTNASARYNSHPKSGYAVTFICPDFAANRPEVKVKDSLYVIRNEGGRFIDVAGNSKDAGANIHLWSANDSGAQVFHVGRNSMNTGQFISGVVSDKDLDTDGNAPGGRNVIQWHGNGADGQQWVFEDAGNGYVYIRNLYGYYLDVENGVNKDGTNIRVWDFNGSSAQKWMLTEVSNLATSFRDDLYVIQNAGGRYLDAYGNGTADGTNIQLWGKNNSGAQLFHVGRNPMGTANFISGVVSDKDLDTEGGTPGGNNVCLWTSNGGDGQQWVFENAGGGYVYIRNLFGYYLDVKDGVNADGTNVRVWYFNGSNAQKWKLIKYENPDQTTKPTKPTVDPGKQMDSDGTALGKGASSAAAEKAITTMKNDKDPKGTIFAELKLMSTKQTKTTITLKWTKAKGATKYVVYGNKCGNTNKMKKITTRTTNSYTVKKALKKLVKGKYYKFIVVALDNKGKVVSTSKVIHIVTTGTNAGNHKSVKISKKVIKKATALKKGKTLKLGAKAVPVSKKKVAKHVGLRYESTNKKIATVSSKGVVKGVKKGTCYVYAYAQSGVFKKIKVVVK